MIYTPALTREIISNWFSERRLEVLDYQIDTIKKVNDSLFKQESPTVLAASPSAGKTALTIRYLDLYLKTNPFAKVLVLTHGTTVLRSQFAKEIVKMVPYFTYNEIDSKVKNFDTQVTIAIPQSLSNLKGLPNFDLIVVDEAHHFYFAKDGQVSKIIKKCKPKHQLLLTGTPSRFIYENLKEEKYKIIPITASQLLEYGMITDIIVEMATSTYDFNKDDYNTDQELKKDVANNVSRKQTNTTMDQLLSHVLKRLTSAVKNNPEAYAYEKLPRKKTWNEALAFLKKSMIACKSQAQAKQVRDYLEKKNINVCLSISDEDSDASRIQDFLDDPTALVLVVVNRGILGFNEPYLENVIDMTCSQNPDVIFQLLGRVFRKHPKGHGKLFIKVVPHKLELWFDHVMTLVMCLTDEEYYLKYNGKNMLDIPIPIKVGWRPRPSNPKPPGPPKPSKDKTFTKVSYEGIPAIEFFKELYHKNRKVLNGYQWTTMRHVRDKINGYHTTIEEVIAELEMIHNG
jgi:superfamily II DNA or RNA helicase